jgi:hypothetical protein
LAAYVGCEEVLTSCGGLVGGACAEDEYCAYVPRSLCGALDAPAVCQPKPDACDGNYDPVCGCDAETHGNACSAALAGTGISSLGECE